MDKLNLEEIKIRTRNFRNSFKGNYSFIDESIDVPPLEIIPDMSRGDTMLKFDFFGNLGFHRSWYQWIFFFIAQERLPLEVCSLTIIHIRKKSTNISQRNSDQKLGESQV